MSSSCCQKKASCNKPSIVWECMGCGYRDPSINMELAPEKCPECSMSTDYFSQVEANSILNECF